MSIAPGGGLDKWLYGISDEEHKTIAALDFIDGHLPGGQQGCRKLGDATAVVRELIFQLCGVFGALQPLAYHRDVSSHNVLVDFSDGPDFTLIDLPGITRVPVKGSDQTEDIEKLTRDMALHYINDPRTIILAVLPANQDMSTSDALQLARQVEDRKSVV